MAALRRFSSAADIALNELDRSELIPTVRGALKELFHLRAIVTAVVFAWGAWISWRIYQSDASVDEEDKYVRMHQVWFGTRPLFETMFNAWATSVVVAIIMRAALKWFNA